MNDEKCLLKHDNLTLIKGKVVNASIARNKLLDIFYNSKDNYCILSDDDTFLKNKININDKIDCLSLTNDYNKKIIKTVFINSAFLIICNFYKKYNIKLYFDEALDSNQDIEFGLNLLKNNINSYRLFSSDIVINKGISSMFKDMGDRIYKKQQSLKYINDKYNIKL
jgi:hypothetical protein